MSEHDERRRNDDKRLDEITETVREIRNILQAENGVCVRMSVAERSIEATQKELSDHKSGHWQFSGILIAAVSAIVGLFEWASKK